ncbi:hypothetical protein HW555_010512 [Spodoptera exigua]|uniref:DNA-directed DNA polymerase family A palm domain-containing protein n=1 Tax=Spodoptera exigua TaxID=7107 RepID=A0A835G9R9_SPOEX|nr:hypothetical protein HW555_010512 [Spodoptera exigua]
MENKTGTQPQQLPTRQNKILALHDETVVDFPQTQAGLLGVSAPSDNTSKNLLDINLENEAVSETNNNNNDFLHPIISNNENLLRTISDKNSSDKTFVEPKINELDINWDDMLDSELFVKMSADGDTDCKELHENYNIIDRTISEENATISCPNAKVRKSNNNATKSNSKLMVEIKQMTKKDFRKQKYTKTVKNWLDNVESPRLVCGNVDNNCSNEMPAKDSVLDNVEPNAHLTKTCDTPDKEMGPDRTRPVMQKTKKVVQAQLANKDGIMKYSKPNITETGARNESVTRQSTSKDSYGNKKIKKFVAPIKSQSVEDVKMQVHSVDEENVANYKDNLLQTKGTEIVAVLIYSNGFCQLNSHYTGDACSPSGVIICHNDMFYSFKTPGPRLKEGLGYLLSNNVVVCYDARSILMYLGSCLELHIGTIDMRDTKASGDTGWRHHRIGASLLDPDNPPENFSSVQRLLAPSPTSSPVTPGECALQRASWYMSQLKECWLKLSDMLKEHSLWEVFIEIEMKVLPIITAMELRGICVDMETLNSMEQAVAARLKAVEQRCYKAAGKVFQISSPAQVRALLYDDLQLDYRCNLSVRGTVAKGDKSTSEATVSWYQTPAGSHAAQLYQPLTALTAAQSGGSVAARAAQAGIGVPALAQGTRHLPGRHRAPCPQRSRPTDLMAAATGRIAASSPNLQAIPKAPYSLVLFPDSDDADAERAALALRACYVARAGRRLLAADFRHLECRLLAHLSADRALLRALRAPRDFFRVLAADWYCSRAPSDFMLKKPESEVVAEERERTKRLVYASLYGAGPRKLMEILGASYPRALQVAASFHSTCPPSAARPGPGGDGLTARCSAERVECAGSAADVCKMAMVQTARALRDGAAELVLQVHDELVWDVDARHLQAAAGSIQRAMEDCGRACGMAMALPVALRVGTDWAHMQPYTVSPATPEGQGLSSNLLS